MKNPLVVFTGAALATLAALAGLKMTDWPASTPEASKATEVTSEAPKPSSEEAEKPAEKPAETAAVQPSEPPQAEAPKAETPASETPAPETPAAETPAAAPAKPELDTVRVEADGQAVVAGRAEPGAEVSLKLGDKVLGKGMANADGAWVVVPDSPLPKGAHELTIEQKSADGATSASEKSIAVAVPEKPGQQAMVALTEPGAATKVLQAGGGTEEPAAEQTGKPAEIVQAEKPAEPAPAEKPVDITPQQTAEASPTPQPEQAPASAPATETTPPSAGEQPAAEQAAGQTVQKTTEAPPAGEVVQKSTAAPAAAEPTQKPAENAGAPAAESPSQTQEMAAVETKPAEPAVGATQPAETLAPKAAEPPAKTADVPLRLDAVDYNDKGDIIFSGRAKPGTAVRLYVDNGSVGDAVVDSAGNWSFAGNDIIAPGTHTLRADQIDGGGKVMARIELPFQREDAAAVAALNAPAQPEPQPTQPEATQAQPVPQPTQPETIQAQPVPQPTQPETTQAQPVPQPTQPETTQAQPVPQPTQPETTQAESAPQPAQPEKTEAQPTAPQTSEVAEAEPEPVTPAPSAPQPSTEPQPAEEPSTGQQPAESQAPDTTEEVAAAPQPEAEAKPAEPARPRSGKVVIQPGNNLWKLSRVIYGRGINFTVIYDANKGQIRDPDLIYPGQIFAIPNATPPESIDPKRRDPLTSAEGGAAQ